MMAGHKEYKSVIFFGTGFFVQAPSNPPSPPMQLILKVALSVYLNAKFYSIKNGCTHLVSISKKLIVEWL